MSCNAPHPAPSVNVFCELEPGNNARTDDTPATYDDEGNEISPAVPGHDVHVHLGREADGSVHRWEDLPA